MAASSFDLDIGEDVRVEIHFVMIRVGMRAVDILHYIKGIVIEVNVVFLVLVSSDLGSHHKLAV